MLIQQVFPTSQIPKEGEVCEPLLTTKSITIERILSASGTASGPYDQEQEEWVLLLEGEAMMEVAGKRVALQAGQALHLPAHCVHRVLDTSAEPPCVWLAVHIKASQ